MSSWVGCPTNFVALDEGVPAEPARLVHPWGVPPDPFATTELRRRVLAAWQESPARFRADANVEDDLALVGYRDRVIVELAQNAADAASRGGVAGRLVLELAGDILIATNTGTPLDAAGVESIAVARASAKVGEAGVVGRFGVGFAAVLAVCDEPSITSSTGAVRWSRAEALASVAALPELRNEVARRGDRVPVLRLPFAAAPAPLADATTAVVLPLRDAAAVEAVRAQLTGVDVTLLLALPGLGEVAVRIDGVERVLRAERSDGDGGDDDRRDRRVLVLSDGAETSRWSLTSASGPLPAAAMTGRPVEEQGSDRWQVTWALPVDDDGRLVSLPDSVAPRVRAPTVVDDPFTLPAVLIASYPLDASRRRVTEGTLADEVTAQAADVLITAIDGLPADVSLLRLVPAGLPDGAVDGALHAAVLNRLRETAWLPVAGSDELRQRPRDAVVVADPLVAPLTDVVPSLLPAGWSHPELITLGVGRPPLAELVAALGSVAREPAWWRALYAGLDEAVRPGPDREALAALPVPLVNGTTVTGPRGLVLPGEVTPAADLSVIGIRMVHPQAAHELLRALGAGDGTPRGLLEQPPVRAAVEESYDAEDPEPVAVAVLSLLAVAGSAGDEPAWLADLALPDESGEWRPAGELVLPGGRMASLIAADSAFGRVAQSWVDRWGAAALLAAGVLDAPMLLVEPDATGATHDLDDEVRWWSTLPEPAAVEDFVAVRDLEQVRADALPGLLELLAQPPLRAAVVEPALVLRPDGGRQRVTSYTAWWLSTRPVLAGRTPGELRFDDSDPLLGPLYDVAPMLADTQFLQAIGVLGSLADADPADVLARLADDRRAVDREHLREIDSWLADQELSPPARVRAVKDGRVTVVDASDAVVVDAPDLLVLLGNRAVVPVSGGRSAELAARLGLPLASELADYDVCSDGTVQGDAVIHEVLRVRDVDGVDREVAWRLAGDTLHVDARRLGVGLGRGRAWRDGVWSQRHRNTEELLDPTTAAARADEDDLDEEGDWR